MQPAEPQVEEPEDSREPNMEPSSGQELALQSEPTVTFLFTLLNTPETKDAESDTDLLEKQFLGQDDWGPKRTSQEIQRLQRDCQRLQEAVNTNQRNNQALGEKLENLPTLLYESLEETLSTPENYRETAKASQEKAKDSQEEEEHIREEAGTTLKEAPRVVQPKRASTQRYSLEPPTTLPEAILFPEDLVSLQWQSALARPEATERTPPQEVVPPVSPSLSTSNKDPH